MTYIDRYLHAVGNLLPRKNREDIVAEIRSHISDTLEERVNGEPTEEDVLTLLKEMGSPQKVARSYSDGQYLIGPELYPFFRMVIGIVLAAIIGSQLLAVGIGLWAGEETLANPWLTGWDILASIPTAIGYVVIVFMILQYKGVNPKLEQEPWDPRSLPEINDEEEVKRSESIFAIVGGSILLSILAILPSRPGVFAVNGQYYTDPVLLQYLALVCLSLLAGIGLETYLLWMRRWNIGSHIARIVIDIFSIVVLSLLVRGHHQWLVQHGSTGFFGSIERMGEQFSENIQLFGMEVFQMAFAIALIVSIIETVVNIYRFIRRSTKKNSIPEFLANH